MGEGELPAFLTELPLLGPLFTGSVLAVLARLVGLALAVVVGLRVLRRITRPPVVRGRAEVSAADLAGQGRFKEAGDASSRSGDHQAALGYYERASAWVKAGHAARRLDDHARAGSCFERGRETKLAAAAYEVAGDVRSLARVAAQSGERTLLTKAAGLLLRQGHGQKAAELYRGAGMLDEAEKAYLTDPDKGVAHAARMYKEAFEELVGGSEAPTRGRKLAQRAADLLARAGLTDDALSVARRAGLARAAAGGPAEGGGAPAGDRPEHDLSIDAPLASLDALAFTPPAPPPRLAVALAPILPGPDAAAARADQPEPAADLAPVAGLAATAVPPARPGPPTSAKGGARPTPPPLDDTGRYEIVEKLGEGGMGEVYEARDLMLGRTVALKFLSASLAGSETAMKMFQREARAAAALNHPAIVTIYDFGVLSGRPFISMERVDGTDLATCIAAQGPLQEQHALELAAQVAIALDFAHEKTVVHRDIKPSNILQARGGGVKILDFGLAKVLHADTGGSSIVAGTPQYMAPEQLAGVQVDGRVDIFALGVTLYEILTGEVPFPGIARPADVEPPTTHAPWLSPRIDEAVLKAIRLAPDERYATGKEMARALRSALRPGKP